MDGGGLVLRGNEVGLEVVEEAAGTLARPLALVGGRGYAARNNVKNDKNDKNGLGDAARASTHAGWSTAGTALGPGHAPAGADAVVWLVISDADDPDRAGRPSGTSAALARVR